MWNPDKTRTVPGSAVQSGGGAAETLALHERGALRPGVTRPPLALKKNGRWPALENRFLPPPNFHWGRFTTPDGVQLRWGHLPVSPAHTQCVLVGGFGEFIEKQFETMRDLAARGIEVWCLDWRGQGQSARTRRLSTRPRARDFDRDAADLAAFVRAKLTLSLPRLLISHSMGGPIGLICTSQHPSLFAGAVLCSPMLGLRIGKLPPTLLRCITVPLRAVGLGLCFIPGVRKWRQNCSPSPDRSRVSADAERCRVTHAWVTTDPSLHLDGATFEWLDSALAMMSRIRKPRFLATIRTPILLGTPERELVVSTTAQCLAARFLPDCTLIKLPDSKHDPFLECDEIRDEWLRRIDAFIAERFLPPFVSDSRIDSAQSEQANVTNVEQIRHASDAARHQFTTGSGKPPVATKRSTVISLTIRTKHHRTSASARERAI